MAKLTRAKLAERLAESEQRCRDLEAALHRRTAAYRFRDLGSCRQPGCRHLLKRTSTSRTDATQ